MASHIERRKFLATLGGAAASWPLAARAQQQPAMPVVGFLSARSPEESAHLLTALRRGLAESGYVEGTNVTIEYRWAFGQYDRLPGLAAEIVRLPVAVLMSGGGEPAALAAKAATTAIPIVFSVGGDPVRAGLVASFNRPGGNATGVSNLSPGLEAKRLGLLHELVPKATTLGVLINPNFPLSVLQLGDVQQAARVIGVQTHIMRATTDREIDAAFDVIAQLRIAALSQAADPFFASRRVQLVTLAARHAVPTMYQFREYADVGGLVSYGIDLPDTYRQIGAYAGRILKGAKPGDLPVMQPTKFELVINLKTARALGIEVPPTLLARADEVIE
jgi:putative ABC transport system substrate-binding protein